MAWNEQAPWTEPAMVEQDLIICKALVCIFSYEFLPWLFLSFYFPNISHFFGGSPPGEGGGTVNQKC